MTTIASQTTGYSPEGTMTQLPPGDNLRLSALADGGQGGLGQAVFFDASGFVHINDGTVPGELCAGVIFPNRLTESSTVAGAKRTMVWQGYGSNVPASTITNDAPTAASQCVPIWDAGNGVPGLLSNYSGSNRSLIGLCFGLDDYGRPRYWAGPVASAVARSVMMSNGATLASFPISDALATDAIAERTIPHAQLHGTVTSIVFNGAAVAANNTDYAIITVAKRDGAGGGAVTLGTYDTRITGNGAITAFVDASFTLSVVAGALNLLETDIITITTTKGGAGQVLTGAVLVNGKVI
ncbi:MAG: hypothetical protein ACM32F_13455 [Betaproteobacteria bacterium]